MILAFDVHFEKDFWLIFPISIKLFLVLIYAYDEFFIETQS